MADKPTTLQDLFLNACRRTHAPVTIFLVRGTKLAGVVAGFDAFSLLLRRDGQSQLLYKHAVSTIAPSSPVPVDVPEGGEGARSLQDEVLQAARRDRTPVTLYLMNGVMLQGRLDAYDQFALLVSRGDQQQLVYKHAISTLPSDGGLTS